MKRFFGGSAVSMSTRAQALTPLRVVPWWVCHSFVQACAQQLHPGWEAGGKQTSPGLSTKPTQPLAARLICDVPREKDHRRPALVTAARCVRLLRSVLLSLPPFVATEVHRIAVDRRDGTRQCSVGNAAATAPSASGSLRLLRPHTLVQWRLGLMVQSWTAWRIG